MFPVVQTYTIEVPGGGIELLLAEAFQIPVFLSESTANQEGNVIMSIPDNATDSGYLVSDGAITTAESLHLLKTNANYQVTTTGNIKLVLQITSGSAGTSFTVYTHSVADTAAGTTIYTYSDTTLLGNNEVFTTEVIEVAVTANDFINVEADSGSISAVKAWFVEKPA